MALYFTLTLTLLHNTSVQAGRVLLSLYALKLGAEPFAIGILAATFSALPMLLSWRIGRIVDRIGSRWPLMLGGTCGAVGMLVPYWAPGLPSLYIAAVMIGLLFAFCAVSLQNLVGLLSSPESSSRNFSNFTLVISVAGFAGPLITGFSIDHAGHAAACLCIALLSLLPVALLALSGGALPRGTRRDRPKGSVRELLKASGLWRVLLTGSLVVTGVELFLFYMPVYGHGIGLSASAIGVLLALFSAAAFIVRLVIPRLLTRWGEERVLACTFFLAAASLLLVPLFRNGPVLGLVSFLFGIGMGCGQPITMMLTFSHSAEGRSGEVLGLRVTVNYISRMTGPIVFGALGSAFGFFPVFWGTALMLAGGGFFSGSGSQPLKPRER